MRIFFVLVGKLLQDKLCHERRSIPAAFAEARCEAANADRPRTRSLCFLQEGSCQDAALELLGGMWNNVKRSRNLCQRACEKEQSSKRTMLFFVKL